VSRQAAPAALRRGRTSTPPWPSDDLAWGYGRAMSQDATATITMTSSAITMIDHTG
jgi:hypothetical protein